MAKVLACPQGHQWEVPNNRNAPTTDVRILCPICGATVDPDESARTLGFGKETVTAPPLLPEAALSLAETLPPNVVPPAEPALSETPHLAEAASQKTFVFPGYEILEELGRGGMGVVYKARQIRLDRLVAIKVLPERFGTDATFAERFNREARALARLAHPNIVAVYDAGHEQGQLYFIMEYVEGMSLADKLRSGRVAPAEAFGIIAPICDALQYAHDEGIVHRDIKPGNILLDNKGRVKVADFGLAKLLGRNAADYTLTGPLQLMGTLRYMAPEQMQDSHQVDHRADVYSLGVVFYEMLTGELPVGRFRPPSQKAPVDGRLDEIVLRALEDEPGLRYQRVSAFRAAIEAVAKETARQGSVEPEEWLRSNVPDSSTLTEQRPATHLGQDHTDTEREIALTRVNGPALGLLLAGLVIAISWVIAVFLIAVLMRS